MKLGLIILILGCMLLMGCMDTVVPRIDAVEFGEEDEEFPYKIATIHLPVLEFKPVFNIKANISSHVSSYFDFLYHKMK